MIARTSIPKLVEVDTQNASALREQLLREITELERQLEQLKIGDDNRNFSLQQTYREMIQCRRGMMSSLPYAANR